MRSFQFCEVEDFTGILCNALSSGRDEFFGENFIELPRKEAEEADTDVFPHQCSPSAPSASLIGDDFGSNSKENEEEELVELSTFSLAAFDAMSRSDHKEEFPLLFLDEMSVEFAVLAVIQFRDVVGEINTDIRMLCDGGRSTYNEGRSVESEYEQAATTLEFTCTHCDGKFALNQMKGHIWKQLMPVLDDALYVCAWCGFGDSSLHREQIRFHCQDQHQISRPYNGHHYIDLRKLFHAEFAIRWDEYFAHAPFFRDAPPKATTFGTDRIFHLVTSKARLTAYWKKKYHRSQVYTSNTREVKCLLCGEFVDILGGLRCPPVIHVWAHVIRSLKTHGLMKQMLCCERCEFGCLDDISMLQHIKLNPRCRILDYRSQFRHEFYRLWTDCFPFIPLGFYVKFAFSRAEVLGSAWPTNQNIRFHCPFCGEKIYGPGTFTLHIEWRHKDKTLKDVEIEVEIQAKF